jgi:transposase-like protein
VEKVVFSLRGLPIPFQRSKMAKVELIIQAVRWYVTYKLSYRDVCDLMAERGVTVVHTTVLRWVQCFVPVFEKMWKKYARPVGSS